MCRKKLRFTDEIGERYREVSTGVVKFYNNGVVQEATFTQLIH